MGWAKQTITESYRRVRINGGDKAKGKGMIQSHTRRLKDGRVIVVKGYKRG